jgi:hypothetical protein
MSFKVNSDGKKKKKPLDPSLWPFALSPIKMNVVATHDLIPSQNRPWSDYYLDYMDRDIYWGQDAALFADAWLSNLESVLNVANIGKASAQGFLGWRMGLYSTLTIGVATEIVVDVLILTTAITLVDINDQHNWGLDDLVEGATQNTKGTLDWSKMTGFGMSMA